MRNDDPIRVLQVIPSMNHGGIEHFIMNLYRAIDKTKVQFDFMYRVPYECAFDSEIASLGGRIYRCVDPDRHPLKSARLYRRFLFKHPEIVAVHEHRSGCDGFFGLMREAERIGIPVRILHSHTSQKGWKHNPIKDVTDAFNAPRLDKFVNVFLACSDLAATHLYNRCSVAMSQCTVKPNAIELKSFTYVPELRTKVRQQMNISDNGLVIGHVGRFVAEKNHTFLLDIIHELHKKGISAEALLIGNGALQSVVKEKALALGIEDYVHFAGIQENTAPFYSAMDVYCMPSVFEGLPVSCIEAQANGLPMLLSTGISRMADICGHASFMTLNDGATRWADAILSVASGGRYEAQDLLATAGYDISELSKWYIRLYSGCGY